MCTQKFEVCRKANEWDEKILAVMLPTLLEGVLIATWMELSSEKYATTKNTQWFEAPTKSKEALSKSIFINLRQSVTRAGNAHLLIHVHRCCSTIFPMVYHKLIAVGDVHELDTALE